MLESILVYGFVAVVMIVCGVFAADREHRILGNKALNFNYSDKRLSFAYIEVILPLFIFAFIFGCRYNVGVDYPGYLEVYLYGGERTYEFLFAWVTEKMSSLGIHYAFYFALWAFLQVFLLFYAFRNQRFLFPYMAFFLIFGSYYMSMMNIIRQQLAACVFMVSLQYIDNKNIVKYVLSVFVASLFHVSAWLLLIVYPLFLRKSDWFPNIKWQFVLYAIAVYLSTQYDLVVKYVEIPFDYFVRLFGYDDYLKDILYNEKLNSINQFEKNTGYGIFISVFLTSTIVLYSKKLKGFYNSRFFNIVYSLWFVRILVEQITGDSIVLNRPFVYVYNFKLIILSCFLYYCFKTKTVMTQVLGAVFILFHIAMLLNIISYGEVNTSAFTFFWQH